MLRKGYTHFLVTVNILTILTKGGRENDGNHIKKGEGEEGKSEGGRGGEKGRNGVRVREGEVGGEGIRPRW